MKLILTHTKWMTLELVRQPAYFVATVAFPSLFYMIFAIPESQEEYAANLLLASFSGFAVFGVLFLQFGVGVAQERSTSWYHYLRTLPLPSNVLIASRFLCAYFFSSLSVLALVVLALIFTEVSMTLKQWALFFLLLTAGGVCFCFMGLCLGYFTSEKSALPVGNLIYLPLSFAGGLWKPPDILPEIVNKVSVYLPTRQYGEILWATVNDEAYKWRSLWTLLAYTAIFILLTYIGIKRDTRRKI